MVILAEVKHFHVEVTVNWWGPNNSITELSLFWCYIKWDFFA